MNAKILLAVAGGGAIGALARYLVTTWVHHWVGHGFPWGTLVVNVVGSFLLGALIEVMAIQWSPGESGRAFLVVGILGAFTTFSTFSLDVHVLLVRDQTLLAGLYILGSVAASVAGLIAGMALFRQILG